MKDKGSITLTIGIIMDQPIFGETSSALANGGIKAFAIYAVTEAPRGIRINTVSPNVFDVALDGLKSYFPEFKLVPLKRIVLE